MRSPPAVTTLRPLSLRQKLRHVARNQVDHMLGERLVGRQADRFAHRALGPFDIAAAHLRERRGYRPRHHGPAFLVIVPSSPAWLPSALFLARIRGLGRGRAGAGMPMLTGVAAPRLVPAPSRRCGWRTGCRCRRWRRARRWAQRRRRRARARPRMSWMIAASTGRVRPACPSAAPPVARAPFRHAASRAGRNLQLQGRLHRSTAAGKLAVQKPGQSAASAPVLAKR